MRWREADGFQIHLGGRLAEFMLRFPRGVREKEK